MRRFGLNYAYDSEQVCLRKMSRPNVLFLVMDTARFSNVFEKSPAVMPGLQEFSNEGTVFGRAMATAPWTVPSHGSMFTGQYPSDHGAHAGTKQFDPESPVLAELFQQAGYQTAAFSNNTWLSPEFGFDKGFESFHVRWELFEGGIDLSAIAKANTFREQATAAVDALASRDAPVTFLNLLYAMYLRYQPSPYDSGARRTNERLLDWMETDDKQPFFAFVNYVEPHLPYEPPPEYREKFLPNGMDPERLDSVNQDPWAYLAGEVEMTERDFEALEALYDAELRYLDNQLSELFNFLAEKGELDETVVVVVGDHGENLGEHGLMDHQYCLYDTLIHVPLVVRYPDAFTPGTEVNDLVELRDLFPTLLDAAGIAWPEVNASVSRRSLVNVAAGDRGRERTFSEYLAPQPPMDALERKLDGALSESVRAYDRGLRAVRTERWKYVEGSNGERMLYELQATPEEMAEVSSDHPEVVSELRELLDSSGRPLGGGAAGESTEMSRMAKHRLEELGYLQ